MILSLENELVRQSPSVWWELHASIIGKDRAAGYVTAPALVANKMQREYAEIWEQCLADGIPCRIIGLKGRQQGSSTMGVAALYWLSRSRNCKSIIVGDEYDKSVKNLVAMFDTYALTDRFDWGNTYAKPSKTFSHGSILETDTANDARAGASGTFQAAMLTEVAHWKETGLISANATFAALLSCVPDLPGTYVLVESTPKGASGAYYEAYQAAISLEHYRACMDPNRPERIPADWNGFFKVFYPWWQHPEYTAQADEQTASDITGSLTDDENDLLALDSSIDVNRLNWRRKKISSPAFSGNDEKFEQEYPRNEKSGFLTSGRRAFPLKPIQQMRKFCTEPKFGMLEWADTRKSQVVFRPTAEDEAIVKIWELPVSGNRYWFPLDPAKGAAQTIGADTDNHAPGVLRGGTLTSDGWHPPALVARLANCFEERRSGKIACRWATDLLSEYAHRLSVFYGKCQIVPEVNQDSGISARLHEMGANVYTRKELNRLEQRETNHLGWRTDEPNRRAVMEMVSCAVRNYDQPGEGLLIWDKLVLDELDTCVVNAAGRVEAMSGAHDDTVLMLGIGLATKDVAKVFIPVERRIREEEEEPNDFTNSL